MCTFKPFKHWEILLYETPYKFISSKDKHFANIHRVLTDVRFSIVLNLIIRVEEIQAPEFNAKVTK